MITQTSLERNKAALAQNLNQCVYYAQLLVPILNKTVAGIFAASDEEVEELLNNLGVVQVAGLMTSLATLGVALNDVLAAQGVSGERVATEPPRTWTVNEMGFHLEPLPEPDYEGGEEGEEQ